MAGDGGRCTHLVREHARQARGVGDERRQLALEAGVGQDRGDAGGGDRHHEEQHEHAAKRQRVLLVRSIEGFCNPPIDNQYLSIVSNHNIVRFEIAMNHPLTMCI
mgnify:CR=1 FL=1